MLAAGNSEEGRWKARGTLRTKRNTDWNILFHTWLPVKNIKGRRAVESLNWCHYPSIPSRAIPREKLSHSLETTINAPVTYLGQSTAHAFLSHFGLREEDTKVNRFYRPSNECDKKLFNKFSRSRLSLQWLTCGLCTVRSRSGKAAVRSIAGGLARKLRDAVLTLRRLNVKRTGDVAGARRMFLKTGKGASWATGQPKANWLQTTGPSG